MKNPLGHWETERPPAKYRMRHLLAIFQKGRCAICAKNLKRDLRPAVDHDHATGEIRGLLCLRCNQTLGHVERYRKDPKPFDFYLDNTPVSQMKAGEDYVGP